MVSGWRQVKASRVGGAAQTKLIKSLSGGIRTDLAQYRELAAFAPDRVDVDQILTIPTVPTVKN